MTMRPEILAQRTAFNQAVLNDCFEFKQDYERPMVLFNNHVETIWAAWFRQSPNLELNREYLPTPDGGVVTLDTLKVESE